ncbi:NADPH-dependent F420 reductase [Sunxiuqinia dokdonensis]|uniref:NADP oxidoreductase coenzyme F420-dependent n=1 Tax=Sunxiuqinia dokdonensis TaxID=1409788 RepID=A0A0L8V7C5_9BACT|nr:NAD(P)-binding domain-containing protein [Sunxiuqinia dokdonensis]KOH44385.1 NADP oxidoreductase coenzyme F420-dependent [Sunxiuqinia dokdonensis]
MRKQVGILGSGSVGRALAEGFLKYGYEVKLGTRDKRRLEDWLNNAGEKASLGTFEEAAHFGDLVVLAVKGSAVEFVLDLAGAANLHEKTVIDTCNPISDEEPVNGVLHFFTKPNTSLMEHLQEKYSRINFVKAFSCVGNALMVNPKFEDGQPTMFICGNNDQAKKQVREVLDLFGWETEDMGKVEAARAIEPLSMLWCIPGFRNNEWRHAFKLLKK